MDLLRLAQGAGHQGDAGADGAAVAAGADQAEADPVPGVAAVVAQQARGLVDVVYDDVEVAVVVQVSEGRAAGAVELLERRVVLGLDLAESPPSVVVEQLVPLLPGGPQ